MGHNLEKNLQRIQNMRAKGQLEKALKQLQDWARKHPDTPHYLYEAAMVAFDLGDHGVGITALKNLVRSIPQTRERVLKACVERFAAKPVLPLGEYLVENLLGEERVEEALDVASQLEPSELELFARKVRLRHDSITSADAPAEALRLGRLTALVVSCAGSEPGQLASAVVEALGKDPALSSHLAELCRRGIAKHPDHTGLRLASARIQAVSGDVAEGCRELAAMGRHHPEVAAETLEFVRTLTPPDEARGRWLATRGLLELQQGQGTAAAASLLEAADLDASLRDEVLTALDTFPDPAEGIGEVLKLRLRLLVVQGRYDEVPGLVDRLRAEGHCDEAGIRTLMGAGRRSTDPRPAELLVVFTETALRGGDLREAAKHVAEIPDNDFASLHKVLASLDRMSREVPANDRLEWLALQAVVQARIGDESGTSETLAELWNERGHDEPSLLAITRTCLDRVAAQASLVAAMLRRRPNGQQALVDQTMESAVREAEGDVSDLNEHLLALLDDDPAAAAWTVHAIDQCDRDLSAAQQLRYPLAVAALLTGDSARAVPEFTILLMGQPQLGDDVLHRLRERALEDPHNADLNLALYELLSERGDTVEAGQYLARALASDPQRVVDLSASFDDLLSRHPQNAELWSSYAKALFQMGRFDQLASVCERAAQTLESKHLGEFRLLQAHVLVEEGKLTEGLELLEQEVSRGPSDAARATEILQSLLAANPANCRAQMLLGEASAQQGDMTEAIRAYQTAARTDPAVVPSVMERLKHLAACPAAEGVHLLEMARIYRRAGDNTQAAELFEHALVLDGSLADRVLGELGREVEEPDGDLALMLVGAKAARHATRVDVACDLLAKLEERDPDRFEPVLAELRKLGEAAPRDITPIRHAARILLRHRAADAACRILLDCGRNDAFPLADRITAIREFRGKHDEDSRIDLALARLLGEAGSISEAVALLRGCLTRDDLEPELAAEVAERLLEIAPSHAELRWTHHDILVRLGQIEEALHTLPDPRAVDEDHLEPVQERYAANAAEVLADPVLAPRYADALRRQGRDDEAVDALRRAAAEVDDTAELPLQTELARALHRSGRTEECREVLDGISRRVDSRDRLYRMFEHWNRERREHEVVALRERVAAEPDRIDLRLQLAEGLLEFGDIGSIPDLLAEAAPAQAQARHRASLLAQAQLRLGRAELADAVLRATPTGDGTDPRSQEIAFLLAECAAQLGRWGDAHTRYLELVDSPAFGTRAQARARDAYAKYLAESAQEYRAVLCKVTDLDPTGTQPQEMS